MELHLNEWRKNTFLYHFIEKLRSENNFQMRSVKVEPIVRFGNADKSENPSDHFGEQEEKHIIYFGDVNCTDEAIFYFGVDEVRGEPQYVAKSYEGVFRSFRAKENPIMYTFNGYKIILPKTKSEYRH